MRNRYPGTCMCGATVEANGGELSKVDGKWEVRCDTCANQPEREMLGAVFWPNGMGETICTLEYEEAVNTARNARRDFEEFAKTCDYHDMAERTRANTLEHAAYDAENKVADLQAAGGHIGERITYDKPDPMTALLAGGSVKIAVGGGFEVCQ